MPRICTRVIDHPVRLVVALGLLVGVAVTGRAAVVAHAGVNMDQTLPSAITAYLHEQESPLADAVNVRITDRADAYARVQIEPTDAAEGDVVTAFARYEDGHWTVLSLGSAFLPEDCAALGLPAALPCADGAE